MPAHTLADLSRPTGCLRRVYDFYFVDVLWFSMRRRQSQRRSTKNRCRLCHSEMARAVFGCRRRRSALTPPAVGLLPFLVRVGTNSSQLLCCIPSALASSSGSACQTKRGTSAIAGLSGISHCSAPRCLTVELRFFDSAPLPRESCALASFGYGLSCILRHVSGLVTD